MTTKKNLDHLLDYESRNTHKFSLDQVDDAFILSRSGEQVLKVSDATRIHELVTYINAFIAGFEAANKRTLK